MHLTDFSVGQMRFGQVGVGSPATLPPDDAGIMKQTRALLYARANAIRLFVNFRVLIWAQNFCLELIVIHCSVWLSVLVFDV